MNATEQTDFARNILGEYTAAWLLGQLAKHDGNLEAVVSAFAAEALADIAGTTHLRSIDEAHKELVQALFAGEQIEAPAGRALYWSKGWTMTVDKLRAEVERVQDAL